MTDLSLAEKVEGLSGPNIGVDLRIIALFRPHPIRKDIAELRPRAILHYYKQVAGMAAMPRYTASVDAVVALVAKELPGWVVANLGQNDRGLWWSELRSPYLTSFDRVVISPLDRPSPALALLAAFLRAKGEQNGAA